MGWATKCTHVIFFWHNHLLNLLSRGNHLGRFEAPMLVLTSCHWIGVHGIFSSPETHGFLPWNTGFSNDFTMELPWNIGFSHIKPWFSPWKIWGFPVNKKNQPWKLTRPMILPNGASGFFASALRDIWPLGQGCNKCKKNSETKNTHVFFNLVSTFISVLLI